MDKQSVMTDGCSYEARLQALIKNYRAVIGRSNRPAQPDNGILVRYTNPVLTRDHVPPLWRYDLNPETNPHLMERMGINSTFNAGAVYRQGKYLLVARVEGYDRKSFFALAESDNPVDGFRFRQKPIIFEEWGEPGVNVYDMRLTVHEDGWIYGLFCVERQDKSASDGDTSSAVASCGIVRTKDFESWQRLPDLVTISSAQQRNVVLHPEFIGGRYGFYTRPADGFVEIGSRSGICWGLSVTMEEAVIEEEIVIDPRVYHTIKEAKNGAGGVPVRTPEGWLHIAHGVRATAAGLRYVLYAFLCDLKEPWRITGQPGGYLMAPISCERNGDVPNVLFCNGVVADEKGAIYIYYASGDTRMHVAATTVEKMLDYIANTPEDGYYSNRCLKQRCNIIDRNIQYLQASRLDISDFC